MIWQPIYRRFLAPRSHNEDLRRRELILNVLIVGILVLAGVMFLNTLVNAVIYGSGFKGVSPFVILAIIGLFLFFLSLSRRGFHRVVAYVFILLLIGFATWPLVRWGILLPEGVLMYGVVIVMAGVLLSSRTAFYVVAGLFGILLLITHLHEVGLIHYSTDWMKQTGGYADVIIYSATFMVIALVAWLSNREIERSLERAKASERALLKERRLLEIKVKERTAELEKAQVEKIMDLQRFAEFGRLSSTLLHELANPLMAVSMNLEQLEGRNRSKLLAHAREGIAHMEQYVEAARRQLRNQSEVKMFDVADEVRRVAGFLEPKATTQRVELVMELVEGVQLKGDSIRFNHIISNLMTNAIDAYDDMTEQANAHRVVVVMQHQGQTIEISVSDHGKGISKEQLPHLFEPFYTTKQMTRGTGLGLAIVKQAVEEAFDGSILVTQNKTKGTQFIVRLPLP